MMCETGEGSYVVHERRMALVHRVIVPDKGYPKEYAILVTDRRIAVPHEAVVSLVMTKGEPNFRLRDLFVWLTMRRQGHKFHVYGFEMDYRDSADQETKIRFCMVPLGLYFKPRRQTQTREEILREYAMDALQIFQKAFPNRIISS